MSNIPKIQMGVFAVLFLSASLASVPISGYNVAFAQNDVPDSMLALLNALKNNVGATVTDIGSGVNSLLPPGFEDVKEKISLSLDRVQNALDKAIEKVG